MNKYTSILIIALFLEGYLTFRHMLILEHALLQIKMATSTGINRDRSQIGFSTSNFYWIYSEEPREKKLV